MKMENLKKPKLKEEINKLVKIDLLLTDSEYNELKEKTIVVLRKRMGESTAGIANLPQNTNMSKK